MIIRSYHPDDLDKVTEIHSLYFKDEFDLPDFLKYICAIVVEDEGKIVTAGGIRPIAECTALTDLSLDPRVRIKALQELLEASTFMCRRSNFDQIYVWSQNAKYTKRLMRNGFRPPAGQSLILDL